ncbi:MAG: GNAT family N-acetyltransferase [Bdellovibrionaceae bacterium]|nr:GNAT family N-acetyltransferase [Pseudobdellovibrionaceae bacterium]
MNIEVRYAKESEATELSDLASRSKAYWPYDQSYLDLCRSVTHVTPEDIGKWPFLVSELQDEICGFAAISIVQGVNMLDHLWIEPKFIGKGVGRLLFNRSVEEAARIGWKSFEIAADPYAEKFYLKMGAVRIGEKESKIKPGFFLPLLKFRL